MELRLQPVDVLLFALQDLLEEGSAPVELVDGGQLGRERVLQDLDDLVVAFHALLLP